VSSTDSQALATNCQLLQTTSAVRPAAAAHNTARPQDKVTLNNSFHEATNMGVNSSAYRARPLTRQQQGKFTSGAKAGQHCQGCHQRGKNLARKRTRKPCKHSSQWPRWGPVQAGFMLKTLRSSAPLPANTAVPTWSFTTLPAVSCCTQPLLESMLRLCQEIINNVSFSNSRRALDGLHVQDCSCMYTWLVQPASHDVQPVLPALTPRIPEVRVGAGMKRNTYHNWLPSTPPT
jgi:hypothetical protein